MSGPPLHLVLDGPTLTGNGTFPVAFQAFRLFVPDNICKAIRLYLVASEGQWEVSLPTLTLNPNPKPNPSPRSA